ncbi:hypothetical protein [Actinoalloteichus caeruleus]|uniref:Archaellum component FlaC n=1 Tax=Actinoalloteichus caeruleus DSM 43889 TaxID=1120930 RepID=A0ABT1JJF0_ACTCY|nr:hypothetical protein [Actinoalloteichus caeruleus]MCP2332281.1 Archaellum component FlaC [Actinoalloteichus caeruleus DSM 43889]
MSYQDASALAALSSPPEPVDPGESIEQMVRDAGWRVYGVDWAFQQVTGQSIVEGVIMPITGDFGKIATNGEAWNKVADGVSELRQALNDNVEVVRQEWDGEAAVSHETFIKVVWGGGLLVEQGVAKLIGMAFTQTAEGSKALAKQALRLLDWLVQKLIDAIAKIWIPAYGWVKAAQLIWDAYQLYQKIIAIVDSIQAIIESAQAIFESVQTIGSKLAEIKDVRSVSDAVDLLTDISDEVRDISGEVGNIRDNAASIRDNASSATRDLRDMSRDARDFRSDYDEYRDRRIDERDGRSGLQHAADDLRADLRQDYQNARDTVRDGYESGRDAARNAWENPGQTVRDGASSAYGAARDGVTGWARDQYQERIGQHVDAARDVGNAAREGWDGARGAYDAVRDGSAWNAARDGASTAWNATQSAISDPGGAVRSAGEQAWNAVPEGERANLSEAGRNFRDLGRDEWQRFRGRDEPTGS